MTWFIFSILHALGIAIANVLRKKIMKNDKSDPVASAMLFQLIGTCIIIIFSLARGFVLPPIAEYPINFIIQGVFWGAATLCLFAAYKYIEASEVTIIVALEAVTTIIVAVIILSEVFTVLNIIGAILILASVFYLSYSSGKMAFNKGVLFSLLYSIIAGFAVVNDTFMLRYSEVLSYLVIGWFTPVMFMMLIKPRAVKKIKPILKPRHLIKHIIFTFIYVLAGLGFFYALAKGGQASQVATISQASVVLTVILATVFLNEKDHLLKKFFCAILVTIGVILLR